MTIPHEMWLSPKIELRSSHKHGTGVFAIAPIEAGEPVEVWGETWEGREVIRFTNDPNDAAAAATQGLLVMRFDTDLWSIEPPGTNPGYFINHSCDSNVWMDDAFTLAARRAIAPGEELTIDYAMLEAEVDDWGFRCACGSDVCRGEVRGDDWRRPDLQERYREHFSPFINKLIDGEIRSTG
jgi:hypothetical protein